MTTEEDEPMLTVPEIAERVGLVRTSLYRGNGSAFLRDLGGPGPETYPLSSVVKVARQYGYLDEAGNVVKRRRGVPVPYPHPSRTSGRILYFMPDVAAMFGVPYRTVASSWVSRGGLVPDEYYGVLPAFYLPTLKSWAKTKGIALDLNARRPTL